MVKTVALVGHAPSTREMAPFKDAVDIWTMNDSHVWIPRADAWFEVHHPDSYLHPGRRSPGYYEHLMAFSGPVYMQYPDPKIPNATALPMAEMEAKYGTVFGSSFAWMFCLAIEQGYQRIELYGCDLASNTEYVHQRESTGFWIGYARGNGIDVYLPKGCPILTRPSYGVVKSVGPVTNDILQNRMAELNQLQGDVAAKANFLNGRRDELSYWRSVFESEG